MTQEELAPEQEEYTQEQDEAEAVEPEKEPEVEAAEPEKEPDMVPHAAMHEERKKRQETEERLRELEERYEQRFQMLVENLPKQEPPAEQTEEDPFPEWDDDDPIASMREQNAWTARQVQGFKQEGAQDRQREQQMAQQAQVQNFIANDYTAFKTEHADIDTAVQFATEKRIDHYKSIGATDSEARMAAAQEAQTVLGFAMQKGRSPARAIYNYAQSLGYRHEDGGKKIEAVAEGQQAAQSLNGGGKGQSKVTFKDLASIEDPEEYQKAFYELYKNT